MIGPLQLRYAHESCKLEAVCHICRWSDFKWKETEAREVLLAHIDYAHINPPPPYTPRASEMPGQGAGCNR